MGIENLLALLYVVLSFINVGDTMGHKSSWSERLTVLMGFFPTMLKLSSIEWSSLSGELDDIDDDEQVKIKEYVIENFDIVDDQLESVIERALVMISDLVGFYKTVKSYVDDVKDYVASKKAA